MSDRSVSVHLKADVAGFISGIEQARLKTVDFAKAGEKAAKDHSQALDKVGKASMLTGGVILAGVGMAVKAYADFSKEMSGVQAVSGANAKQMDQLGKAAIKAGADTVFSASEAAKAEGELAKAGVKTSDILGGALTGSLNLASAGGLDLANAATISAQAMNIFGLKGQDVAHIADVLASGANKSAADVQGLGDALKQGGLVAAQTGMHLEDTAGILSMFADNALIGSDAGTSLKTMLMALTPSSVAAQNAMDDIGFSAYDAQGKFVGMESVAQQLKDGLGGLTEAHRALTLKTIFGSDATRAASILYQEGAAGVRDYTTAVNDQGAAQRMASVMLNNLSGDFEALKGSIDTALIQSGSAGNGVLRDLVQGATSAVNAFGNLPAPLQQGALGIAAVTGAVLLTGGAIGTLVPKLVVAKASVLELAAAAKVTRASMMSMATGPIGVALAGITVAVGLFAKSQMDAKGRSDDLRGSLDQTTGAITDQTRVIAAKQLQDAGAFRSAKELGIGIDIVNQAAMGNKPAMDQMVAGSKALEAQYHQELAAAQTMEGHFLRVNPQKQEAATKTLELSNRYKELVGSVSEINGVMNPLIAETKEVAVASGTAADGIAKANTQSQAAAQSEKDLAAAADAAKKAHDALTASITGYGSAMMTARGDARSYEAAIDAATASVKENGRTLDVGTEKGRANAAALDGIATAALKAAESNLGLAEQNGKLGAASKSVTGDINTARDAFINQAVAMGMPKKAAAELATQSGLTAGRVKEITDKLIALGQQNPKPVVTVSAAQAHAEFKALQAEQASIRDKTVTMTVQSIHYETTITRKTNEVNRAAGGLLTGPGTGTSDSIPVNASNGEFWVNAAATAKNLPLLHAINSGAQGYASGGMVTRAPHYSSAPMVSAPSASSGGTSMVDISALTAGQAEQTQILRTLIPGFGAALDKQARTIETMKRKYA